MITSWALTFVWPKRPDELMAHVLRELYTPEGRLRRRCRGVLPFVGAPTVSVPPPPGPAP